MEEIITNTGLQHLAENVFWNLEVDNLKICAKINQSCEQILQNPTCYLKKFEHLSKENQKDWIKAIQSVNNSDDGIAIISYLQWNLKKDTMVDLLCYSNPAVQDHFNKRIMEICRKWELSDEDTEIVKILAPLTDNPNAPDKNGDTPIHEAACHGYTEIVKILGPLTDNPNAPDKNGETPIHEAACNGHTEIVKILAPLTDNPNPTDEDGKTPIHWAAYNGQTEIVKILAPLTDNPNAPNNNGTTPISRAVKEGNLEIIKILAPLSDNPNSPDNNGITPIHKAVKEGNLEIIKILAPLSDNPNAPDNNGITPINLACNIFGKKATRKIIQKLNMYFNF